jgi:ATP-binding cassette, subfamily C, bacterial LapB
MTPSPNEKPPRFGAWIAEPMARNRSVYIKVAFAAALINIFGIVTSLFTMTVYDRVIPNNATASLVALSIGLAVVIIFDFILRTLRAYFADVAGAQIDQDVGETVFARLLALRLDIKTGSTGGLAGLMRELETLRDFFASVTLTALVDVPFIALTLLVIVIIGGPIVLVPLVMVPLVVIAAWLTQPALDRLAARSMDQAMAKQAVLVETIGGLETVKASGAGGLLGARWSEAMERHSAVSLNQRLVSSIAVNIAVIANTISYAGVVVVGVGMIDAGALTTGGLIACSILAGRAVAPLGQIAQLLSRLNQTRTAYRQINALMAAPKEGPAATPLALAKVDGRIEFRGVDFRYPGQSEKALSGVSFIIERGDHVALIGRVGSGKSTVARLILGLYPPEDGLVLLDGTDIRQLDHNAMRHHFGVALQDNVLLSGSVRENITLDRGSVDDDELLRVAQMSGTHEFIGRVANGYDLRLSDRGDSLSGGQRQSIALARALASRPPLLIFDEPTSAMDAQTEAVLIDKLATELKGRTLILITHRPPMLRLIDRVILLDQGRVVADGPRDTVLNTATKKEAA